MKVTKEIAQHYLWGKVNQSWKFLSDEQLNVHLEIIEPSSGEIMHYHKQAMQFFYIIEGQASFILNEKSYILNAEEGIQVKVNQPHLIKNESEMLLKFLVITSPYSELDRFNVGQKIDQEIHLNNRKFKGIENSDNGEVSEATIFHYRQKESIIWATYEGGDIHFGTLSGIRKDNQLSFRYQHLNQNQLWMSGKCDSIISQENGKIRLDERWQWTTGDRTSGTSVLIEL